MYGLVTVAATLVVATVSSLIVVLATRLETQATHRAGHGEDGAHPPSPAGTERKEV